MTFSLLPMALILDMSRWRCVDYSFAVTYFILILAEMSILAPRLSGRLLATLRPIFRFNLSIMLLNAYSAPALGQVAAGKRGAATSIAPETESRLPVPLNIKWSGSVRFLTIVELVIRSHIQYLDDR